MRARAALAAAALALLLPGAPGLAAGGPIVAGPGAFASTYATPVVAWTPGTALTFVNADIREHDVVSDETRPPGSAPWCPADGPRCPLFFADLVGIGASAEVQGLEDIPSGQYLFRCSPHPWMEGILVVP